LTKRGTRAAGAADRKSTILAYLERHESCSGRELARHLGITRQALNLHLRKLVRAGRVLKTGSTRGARYSLAARRVRAAAARLSLRLSGADEAAVYDRLAAALNLKRLLRPNVEAIVHYAFTEMLNNAIEHSGSPDGQVRVSVTPAAVAFEVRDHGIGVFHSIRGKLGLEDEHAALIELLKGKTTTLPERHTGEGIFFTSRVAERFRLRSHRIGVEWDRPRADVFVSQARFLKGTRVEFSLERATRLKLEQVFSRFAPAEYDFRFEKTSVLVKLLQTEYVSRSEAKRLVANLDRFREVVLDFKDVKAIGQGFADEIFRVFTAAHPGTEVSAANANPVVDAMIRHARTASGV
jgi:anti-sigma regulatory factor (Ser/Thr protein kinase)/biotin operon repressor